MIDHNGRANHVLWHKTGRRRNCRYTPCEMVGVEYAAPSVGLPRDGGVYPAGNWVDTFPTGECYTIWD